MDKCIPFGSKWSTFNVAFNDQMNLEKYKRIITTIIKNDIYQHYCIHYKFSQMIRIFGSVLYYVIILFPFDIRLDIMKPSLGSIVL